MKKEAKSVLTEDSAVNSVAARLALYVALAGAAGAGVAVALKRHNSRMPALDEPLDHKPES
jgi:uncharacterized protein YlxW (UPF0749 family)